MKLTWWILVAVAAGLAVSFEDARAADDDVLISFVRNLQDRRIAVTRLRCVVRGRAMDTAGSFNKHPLLDPAIKQAPEKDTEYPVETKWLLDFPHNRFRKVYSTSMLDLSSGKYNKTVTEEVSNGKEAKLFPTKTTGGSAGTGIPYDLIIQAPGGSRPSLCSQGDYPVFFGCGVVPVQGNIDPCDFHNRLDSGAFAMHGKAVIGGEECWVIRSRTAGTPVVHEFWLDKDCRFLRRHVFLANGEKVRQVDITEYVGANNIVHPSKWIQYTYSNGELDKAIESKVEQWDMNPDLAADEFEVKLSPGMAIMNNGDRKMYRVASDGETLVEAIAPPVPVTRRKPAAWGRWLAAGGLILCAAGTVALVYRRYFRGTVSGGKNGWRRSTPTGDVP